jgi:hypothetical protein
VALYARVPWQTIDLDDPRVAEVRDLRTCGESSRARHGRAIGVDGDVQQSEIDRLILARRHGVVETARVKKIATR